MNLCRKFLLFILCVSLTQLTIAQTPTETSSALPKLVRFTGTAKDLNSNLLTGVVGITFALYSEQTGGPALWIETQNVTADTNGHYTALLGSTKPNGVPADIFTSEQAHWVGVQISGQAEQARVLLVSTPYAFKAGDAETVGGLPPSAFMLARTSSNNQVAARAPVTSTPAKTTSQQTSDVTTTGGKVGFLPVFSGASTIVDSSVFQTGSGSTVKVGINTNAPTATLDVNGSLFLPNTNTGGTQGVISIGAPILHNYGPGAGSFNIFLGIQSGNFSTAGTYNTGTGYNTLRNNNGFSNTANGADALLLNTSGGWNTGTGTESLYNNTIGYYNTAAGNGALYGNTSGQYNTAAGNFALDANTTGSNNTALGAYAGPDSASTNLSNSTAIGSNAVVSVSNALVLGATTAGSPGANHVNVGIGTAVPESTIEAYVTNNTGLGPTFTLTNGGIGSNVSSSLDFNTFPPNYATNYNPTARILATDDGHYASNLIFYSNKPDAQNNGLVTNMTVFSTGNVDVTGTLTAGAKNFKIDHPLDPANEYLFHASVESSEMMNIYTGNVSTNSQGFATVQLPEWFEALNTDFRYQLTVMGQFAQAIVSSKVANHQFGIQTDKPNVEVSWQITGVRHDAYAKAYPLVVEQQKDAHTRGHYIHPELYGQPASTHSQAQQLAVPPGLKSTHPPTNPAASHK